MHVIVMVLIHDSRYNAMRYSYCSPNHVLSRRCGRACFTSQEKHLLNNPDGKVRARARSADNSVVCCAGHTSAFVMIDL